MMMRGFCNFPMTSAYIHTVMPSLRVSFKMGSPIRTVGTIYQDRTPAIAGRMGLRPDTIPVKTSHELRRPQIPLQLHDNPGPSALLSKLLASVLLNTPDRQERDNGGTLLRTQIQLYPWKTQKPGRSKPYPCGIPGAALQFQNRLFQRTGHAPQPDQQHPLQPLQQCPASKKWMWQLRANRGSGLSGYRICDAIVKKYAQVRSSGSGCSSLPGAGNRSGRRLP